MRTLKNYALVLFLAPLLFAISCKNGENEEVNEEVLCLISEFIQSSQYDDGDGYTSEDLIKNTYTYNEDGKIVTLAIDYSEEYCSPESSTCDTYEEMISYEFTYNGDKLSSIDASEEGFEYSISVVYDGDRISKFVEKEDEDYTDEYRLIYEDNRVVKIENWDNYSFEESGFHLYGSGAFTYSNDNVIKVDNYYNDELDNGGRITGKRLFRRLTKASSHSRTSDEVLEEVANFTYDTQSNPFSGSIELFLTGSVDFVFLLSKNNPISASYKYPEDSDPYYSTSVEYTYNEQGFPVSGTVISDDGESEFTFSYSNCQE